MDGRILTLRLPHCRRQSVETWLSAALTGTLGIATVLSALILFRRFSGALLTPLSPPVLLAVGLVMAIWYGTVVVITDRLDMRRTVRTGMIATTLVVVAAFALGVWLPGTSTLGALLLWLPIVAACAGSLISIRRRGTGAIDEDRHASGAGSATEELPADDVIEQVVRRREADGTEQIHAWVRAALVPGQQSATAHVAFCPPCQGTVECEAEQADGPPARVRVGQLLPHGARLDVRLERPAESMASVLVEVVVRSGQREVA